jgi:hypothetical protein
MTSATINYVTKLLEKHHEEALRDYSEYRKELQDKYDTVWLDNAATSDELDKLRGLKEDFMHVNDALNDFSQSEWMPAVAEDVGNTIGHTFTQSSFESSTRRRHSR